MIPTKYHKSLRNFLAVFGYQFSNITVNRHDDKNKKDMLIEVPIEYSQKAKWLRMLESDASGSRIAMTLPRLSYEIVGISYVGEETLNQNNVIKCYEENGNILTINNPVTYTIDLMLNIVTKLQEDGYQILEQILPRFSPNETWEYLSVPKMNISNTVPVTLNTATPALQLDPDPKTSEVFMWMLSFSAKVQFYGAIYGEGDITPENAAILKVNIDIDKAMNKFVTQIEGHMNDGSITENKVGKNNKMNLLNIHTTMP